MGLGRNVRWRTWVARQKAYGTGRATINTSWLGRTTNCGTWHYRISRPNRTCNRSGSYAMRSFHRIQNGWRIHRMKQETGRSMFRLFRVEPANGKCPGEEESRDGGGTERRCFIYPRKGK